jgi:hypothetical protein
VDDRFAHEREWTIFQGERNNALKGLTIQMSPLLGAATCCYHFPEGESETYELLIMHCQGFDALRLFRNDGGRYLPVHYGVVPFSYDELLNVLRDLPETKPFVEILEQPALQWLATRDFSLDRNVAVSEFLSYDYPPVYWFIVANSRFAGESVDGVIDRDVLSHFLGVTALQSGQLAAMRRLKIEECSDKIVGNAIGVLAKQWSFIKPLLVHEPELDPALVCFLGIILDHISDINRCRWFTYRYMAIWLWHPPEMEHAGISIESAASLFLVEWFSLQVLGINPASLDSGHRMYYVIEREAQRLLRGGGFSFNQLNETVKSSIHVSLQAEVDEWLNQQNDLIYNDYDDSAIWNDNDPFPSTRLMQRDSCFTPVTTAGELRLIASKLKNCAASRVAVGMSGNAEFWIYQSCDDGELALLQLDVKESDVNVTEFKGFQNATVSDVAHVCLHEWLSINKKMLAGFNDAD